MLVWIFPELHYQQALVDHLSLHDHIPQGSSKVISEQAYIYHSETQGEGPAFCSVKFSHVSEVLCFIVTPTFPASPSLLSGGGLILFLLTLAPQEVANAALLKPPGLFMLSYIVLLADIGVVIFPHEDLDL